MRAKAILHWGRAFVFGFVPKVMGRDNRPVVGFDLARVTKLLNRLIFDPMPLSNRRRRDVTLHEYLSLAPSKEFNYKGDWCCLDEEPEGIGKEFLKIL